jgi:Zn-dependent M28 family amino/carboxypeptidase
MVVVLASSIPFMAGIWSAAAAQAAGAAAQAPQEVVSRAAIEASLRALDVDRTTGGEGERQAYDFLEKKLRESGIRYTRYSPRLFLSWPGKAELAVEGGQTARIVGESGVFAAPTAPGGVAARLLFDPPFTRRADRVIVYGPEVGGRLIVVPGELASENVVMAAQRAGAAGVVQVDVADTLHEETVMSSWGAPTTESAWRVPSIPYICIRKSDGDRLRASASNDTTVRLTTEMKRGWRTVPMIVADVPGRSPDFVLVTTHLDAWYHGMHDTAGTVATILEMARIFQARRDSLERGIRFAWWTGHSFGRYAGSAWYADHAYGDLETNCVAHMNLDMVGARGSQMDGVSASGWPGLADYAREVAARVSGKAVPAGRRGPGFRPGRDSDSSFQGLGIPQVSVGLPGPPAGHPDMEPGGRYRYWHTPDDTFDKLDLAALERDTTFRVALLQDLATRRVLPHSLTPIAASYRAAVEDLAAAAKGAFDLSSTRDLVTRLGQAADRVDALPRPADPRAATEMNRLLASVSRRLNSTLYTRAGRFDQDPASEMPVLPLLARVRDLAALPPESDESGFLQTELLRGRNAVESTLREAVAALEAYGR